MARKRKSDTKSWIAIYVSMLIVLLANGAAPVGNASPAIDRPAIETGAAVTLPSFFQPRLKQAPRKDI